MSKRSVLAGSQRQHPAGTVVGAPEPGMSMSVGVHFKHPTKRAPPPGSAEDLAALARPASRAQLAARRRRTFDRAARYAAEFAAQYGLHVDDVDLARRRVVLTGPAAAIEQAFATRLVACQIGAKRFHSYSGPLHIPQSLAPFVNGVLGLDTRPLLRERPQPFATGAPSAAAGASLWPAEIARLYGIVAPHRGAGQCVAIIAPRGGYLQADLALAAAQMGVAFPEVASVSVDNGRNAFAGGSPADQEVALDLQVVAAVAPAARLVIYFTNDSEQGLADAVLAAVHDQTHRPSVISISWGEAELNWPRFPLDILNGALADAVQLGVVVTAAAGDALATDDVGDDLVHVNYPASSPYVLGCGGTRIALAADGTSIAGEVVWNDGTHGTGGGVSDLFDVPDYQQKAGVPASVSTGKAGRGVPDVAAAAAFANGYRIFVNQKPIVQGGTSAVAPLWAGLVALMNSERGKPLRFLNPLLYADPTLCRRITEGNNKAGPIGYAAGPGWSACTGLGVPMAQSMFGQVALIG